MERAASGGGPTLIEAFTYRMEGHSTSDDPRAYRPDDQVDAWRGKDPLLRTRKYLENKKWWSSSDEDSMREEIEKEIIAAIAVAEEAGPPALESMFEDVYAELDDNLKEQREALLNGPRAPKH